MCLCCILCFLPFVIHKRGECREEIFDAEHNDDDNNDNNNNNNNNNNHSNTNFIYIAPFKKQL